MCDSEPSMDYKVASKPDQATEKTLLQKNVGDGEGRGKRVSGKENGKGKDEKKKISKILKTAKLVRSAK